MDTLIIFDVISHGKGHMNIHEGREISVINNNE